MRNSPITRFYCRNLSAGWRGRSLSAPAQSRYDALPVKPRQVYHWFDGSVKNLSPILQCKQRWLADLNAYYSLITGLAALVAVWMLFVLLLR